MTTRIAPADARHPLPPSRRAPRLGEQPATRMVVSTLGTVVALAGIEHGVGELLQGRAAPDELVFLSWPDSDAFRIMGGEPALTIWPSFLATGILAIGFSLAFLVWATVWLERRHAGWVLMFLALGMLLFGGGVGPPVIGFVLAIGATRINTPLVWWQRHLSSHTRGLLGRFWPWALGLDVVAWLLLVPGSVILGALVSADNPDPVPAALVYGVIGVAVTFVLLALGAALAHDSLGGRELLTDM